MSYYSDATAGKLLSLSSDRRRRGPAPRRRNPLRHRNPTRHLEGGAQMTDYETYCRLGLFHQGHGLTTSLIGRKLGIDSETAAKYATLDTCPRLRTTKPDKVRPLQTRHHAGSNITPKIATQTHQRLRSDEGYAGVIRRRPAHRRARLGSADLAPSLRRNPAPLESPSGLL